MCYVLMLNYDEKEVNFNKIMIVSTHRTLPYMRDLAAGLIYFTHAATIIRRAILIKKFCDSNYSLI